MSTLETSYCDAEGRLPFPQAARGQQGPLWLAGLTNHSVILTSHRDLAATTTRTYRPDQRGRLRLPKNIRTALDAPCGITILSTTNAHTIVISSSPTIADDLHVTEAITRITTDAGLHTSSQPAPPHTSTSDACRV